MKTFTSLISLLLVVTACSMLGPTKAYKQALAKTTAQEWVAGVKGGGRGVTYRVTFYKLEQPLTADTLWVNNYPLQTEVTRVGDTTYVTSFIHVLDDAPEQPLIKDDVYSGQLQVYVGDKKKQLQLGEFQSIPTTLYP